MRISRMFLSGRKEASGCHFGFMYVHVYCFNVERHSNVPLNLERHWRDDVHVAFPVFRCLLIPSKGGWQRPKDLCFYL